MQNELIWLATLAVNFILILLAFRMFGRIGLYVWTAICVIIANIQVLKTISMFGFVTAEGNIIYLSTFLATDILNEMYGKSSARKAVWLGFFALIATTIMIQLNLWFVPHATDTMQPHLVAVFSVLPRIAIASLTAYIISEMLDIWIFQLIKKRLPSDGFLWLRATGSTVVSQLIDNVIFTLIAFVGVFDWGIILQIFITSYIMKFIVSAAGTPFLYYAKKLGKKVPAD